MKSFEKKTLKKINKKVNIVLGRKYVGQVLSKKIKLFSKYYKYSFYLVRCVVKICILKENCIKEKSIYWILWLKCEKKKKSCLFYFLQWKWCQKFLIVFYYLLLIQICINALGYVVFQSAAGNNYFIYYLPPLNLLLFGSFGVKVINTRSRSIENHHFSFKSISRWFYSCVFFVTQIKKYNFLFYFDLLVIFFIIFFISSIKSLKNYKN